jgi:hypothetical protein
VQHANIPAELRERPQWVTWKLINGTKVPFNARTGKAASSTDPATWATYDEACRAAQHRHHAGIGYVFSADDPFVGIDLDDCIDAGGTLQPWAAEIVTAMGSYAEISPSGTGVKLFVAGSVPDSVKTEHIEIYPDRRYFTVTGQRLEGTPAAICAVNGTLTALYESLRPPPQPQPEQPATLPDVAPDADYIRRWCLAALEGEQQKMLAAGDHERHNRRYASAHALGGLVHTGGLTEQEIFDALAVNFGPNQANAEKTIRDGMAAGMERPRSISAPRPRSSASGPAPADTPEAEYWRQEAEYWRGKYERLDAWRAWALQVAAIPTERLSPAAKVVAVSLWPEIKSRESRGVDEPQRIYIDEAKDKAGLSAGTYGAKLKELADVGAIARIPDRQPNGHKKILIQPTAFDLPSAWAPAEPRNHGGERPVPRPAPACPTHGEDAPIVEEVTIIRQPLCGTCATQLGEHTFTQERRTVWDPNTQLAQREKNGSSSPIGQVAGWLDTGADADEANTQIAGWPLAAPPMPDNRLISPRPPDTRPPGLEEPQIEIIGSAAGPAPPAISTRAELIANLWKRKQAAGGGT